MPYRLRFLLPAVLLFVTLACDVVAQDRPPYDHPLFTGPVHEVPESALDQKHLRLAVRFDAEDGHVFGDAQLYVRPLQDSLKHAVLFGAGLHIDSVFVGYDRDALAPTSFRTGAADSLIIALEPLNALRDGALVPSDAPFLIRVVYDARPSRGLYFIAPTEASPDPQIWTQGEPEDHRHWFPIIDTPGDKLTTELIVTVDESMQVLSNGVLVDARQRPDGTMTYHYLQKQPHAPYLVTLVAGTYEVVQEHYALSNGQRLPLSYWVYPGTEDHVSTTFGRTDDMLRFFSQQLAYPYPWSNYAQIVVRDYFFGGMENTGATTLTDRALVDARSALDYDPDRLIAHELAHQWFGNLVTARYWTDIWLNEGFATYLAALFTEHHKGAAPFALLMQDYADRYLSESGRYRRPLVWDRWEAPIQMFDAHSYQKGAWVLHMLRRELGDDVFWQALSHYLKRHPFDAVETQDLRQAVEAAAGRDLTGFFDQWVYAAGHPVLDVQYDYDPQAQALTLTVRQTQEGFLVPDAFRISLAAEIHTLAGSSRVDLEIDEREETFTFPLQMQPRFVLLDPDHDVLAEHHLEQPATAWVAQLRYATDAVSRLRAARTLRDFVETPALFIGLRSALDGESSAAVQTAIIQVIGALPPAAAAERALIAAYESDEADVRRAAVEALAAYEGSSDAIALAFRAAQHDASNSVQAAAVRTLARIAPDRALDVVRSALITPSYRDVIRQAAFDVLPDLDLPARDGLKHGLAYTRPGHAYEVRAAAAGYLAYLASEQKEAMKRLVDLLTDPSFHVRRAAIMALGRVGSEEARRALEARLAHEPQPLLTAVIRQALQQNEK